MQRECGARAGLALVRPLGERGEVDGAAAEDRPQPLLQVGAAPQLGHKDAEQEVVAEGAECQPVLVAVLLLQLVEQAGDDAPLLDLVQVLALGPVAAHGEGVVPGRKKEGGLNFPPRNGHSRNTC